MHRATTASAIARAIAITAATLAAASLAPTSGPRAANASDHAPLAERRAAAWETHVAMLGRSETRGLEWRSVGPRVMGGRLVDVAAIPGEPYGFYVAYASGGLWRTRNNGVTFESVFDGQPTSIMGDVAIAPSSPDVVWVGTGENNASRSSYGGAGVFRTEDGGETWRAVGLAAADRIGRILVDPRDPDRAFVAAAGRLYTEGGARGVYRTEDGGATWEPVLPTTGMTGAIDLAFDPRDPDRIYAATWERSRRPWNFVESGEGSALFVSSDGGDTWDRVGGGFPRGEDVGRIGIAIADSDPDVVYAFIDDQELLPEALWDLGDGAVTAKRLRTMSREELLASDPVEVDAFLRRNDFHRDLDAEELLRRVREGELTIDDLLDALGDANTSLFRTDVRGATVWRSDDRGRTWRRTHDDPIREMVYTYGYYFGQVRVAPDDPDRVYILGVPMLRSDDGGATWTNVNPPHVHVDHQSMWIDPESPDRIVSGNDGGLAVSWDGGDTWIVLNPTEVGQFYTVAVDMEEPYRIYGGLQDNGVWRGSSRTIPGESPAWTRIGGGDGMVIEIDPRDGTVYWGYQFGNYFRVDPDGSRTAIRPRHEIGETPLRYNWQTPIQLSPHNADIVYFGAHRLYRSMDRGETWKAISPDLTSSDARGDVPFATLTSIDESDLAFGRIWVGTDDGHVHVTRDGGDEWSDVTPELDARRWVSRVEASHHDEDRAYVALNGYRDDDPTVYLFRTDDLGSSWTAIGDGIPASPVNVVREDLENEDVVYVGTDRGAYVSLDRGASWSALGAGLPVVPVHDMVVHPRDRELVAGTHGRSVWVLDVHPIQELTEEVRAKPTHVFPVDPVTYDRAWRARRHPWWHRPKTDPFRDVSYWSREGGDVTIEIRDADGRVLRRESAEALPGLNTWRWDLLLEPDLAVEAERARVEAEDAEKEAAETTGPIERARIPWAEAVRLERPVYVTPGTYAIAVDAAEFELAVEPAPDPAD